MACQTEHKESLPAQIAGVWVQRVTLRMCEESGQKDGIVLENRGLLHSAFPSKVGSENTLVCYGSQPSLYTGVPDQAKNLFCF